MVAYQSPTSVVPRRLCTTAPTLLRPLTISTSSSSTHCANSMRCWFFTSNVTPRTPSMSPRSSCHPALVLSAPIQPWSRSHVTTARSAALPFALPLLGMILLLNSTDLAHHPATPGEVQRLVLLLSHHPAPPRAGRTVRKARMGLASGVRAHRYPALTLQSIGQSTSPQTHSMPRSLRGKSYCGTAPWVFCSSTGRLSQSCSGSNRSKCICPLTGTWLLHSMSSTVTAVSCRSTHTFPASQSVSAASSTPRYFKYSARSRMSATQVMRASIVAKPRTSTFFGRFILLLPRHRSNPRHPT